MTNTTTFTKVATGHFKVLLNGNATEFTIVNGSAGVSGNSVNEYLICNSVTGTNKNVGSLQKAKKILTLTLKNRIVETSNDDSLDISGWIPVEDENAWKASDAALIAAHKAK